MNRNTLCDAQKWQKTPFRAVALGVSVNYNAYELIQASQHSLVEHSLCGFARVRRPGNALFFGALAGIKMSLEKLAEIVQNLSHMLSFFQRFPGHECGKLNI